MERHEVLEMMAALKLAGMRDAFDEVLADGLKRQHPMQRIIGELLKAEIADKQARSIKYQMSGAKLPLAKELADFDFTDTPVNEPLVREAASWPTSATPSAGPALEVDAGLGITRIGSAPRRASP